MEVETFEDVFDALENTPPEAAKMRARADLLAALIARINSWNLTQQQASLRLGITRPRLNDLLRGKIGRFSLDSLVKLTSSAGLTLEMRISDAA